MKQSEHYDLVFFYSKVHSVWKSPEQTAPESAMNQWIKQRIASDLGCVGIKHPNEFIAKTW